MFESQGASSEQLWSLPYENQKNSRRDAFHDYSAVL
jgi:hypothetical protein